MCVFVCVSVLEGQYTDLEGDDENKRENLVIGGKEGENIDLSFYCIMTIIVPLV